MKTLSKCSSRSLRPDRDGAPPSFAPPSRRRSWRTRSVPPPKRTAESPTALMTPGSILASGSRSRPRIVAGGDGEAIRDLVGEPATSRGAPAVLLLSRNPAYAYLNKVLVAEVASTIRGIPQEVTVGRPEGLPSTRA